MEFENENGDTLELSLISWEFPNDKWIMVRIKCKNERGSWEGVDPSLTESEVTKLSKWLVSGGSRPDSSIDFLEPELEFRFVSGMLQIYLEFKYRPPWAPSDFQSGDNYFYMEFNVSDEILSNASENLILELMAIPG